MKIISKYKDFYDHLWFDEDPDIVYIRKEKVCFNNLDNIIKGNGGYERELGRGIESILRSSSGDISVIGFTFGIYPYVYTTPALAVGVIDYENVIKILSKSEVDSAAEIESKSRQSEYFINIVKDFFKGRNDSPKDFCLSRYYGSRGGSPMKDVMRYCWKKEVPDIFLKLKAPVFVSYCGDIIGSAYSSVLDVGYEKNMSDDDRVLVVSGALMTPKKRYVTNVCFEKLNLPITKYWFEDMNNINTYSNIENFLMTSKMDPEPVISNNGKIIAHGFDLKTSFRKM